MVEANPQFVRQGLLSRGLPAHIADGFVMNIADESGFNAGINELRPTVPGSRGGFGLYQLTGPRRVAFEQFAAQRGVNPSDPDAQLDFLMTELQGPESRAAQSIFSTQDAPSAAVAIARDFLRPAPQNLQRRVARYTGGMTPEQSVAMDTRDALGYGARTGASQMEPINGQPAQQPGGLRGLLSDPDFYDRLAIGLGGLTQSPNTPLMQMSADRIAGRAQTRQETSATNRTVEYLRSQGRADLADAVASGALGGRDAAAILFQEPATSDPYSTIGKLQADLAAGRINQEQYEVAVQGMAPQGMSIRTTPDGGVELVQGAGVSQRPLTEGQSKDTVYATRAQGALPVLDQYDVALADLGDRALSADPTGILRGRMQSTDFQLAQQAADEFLQAILRKDTGAAITAQEQQLYGVTYLPQPGDSPEVIAQKRQARQRALEAIKAGLPPSAIVAQERALEQSGSGEAAPTTPNNSQMSDDELLRMYGGN